MDEWDIQNSSKYLIYEQNRIRSQIDTNIQTLDINMTLDDIQPINCWKNAFGSTIVQQYQKQRWRLKLCEASTYYSARIGVIDIDEVYDNDLLKDNGDAQSALDRVSNKAFVMSCFTGYFWHKSVGKPYGKQCKHNSVIIMELDLFHKRKGGRLRYKIDGVNYGYATQSIDCSKKYILAVSLVNDESVILLKDQD